MRTIVNFALVSMLSAALAACGGSEPSVGGGGAQALGRASAGPPAVPLCAQAALPAAGQRVAVQEDADTGLLFVLIDGRAVCLDSLEGAARSGLLTGDKQSSGGASTDSTSGSGAAGNGGTSGAGGAGGGGSPTPLDPTASDPMPAKGGPGENNDPTSSDGHRHGG